MRKCVVANGSFGGGQSGASSKRGGNGAHQSSTTNQNEQQSAGEGANKGQQNYRRCKFH